MIRNLKTMGLALVALLAMSALLASVASAQFESEAASTTLSVSSNTMQKFAPSAGGAAVECTTVELDNATISGTENTTVEVTPTYLNCENFLGAVVNIDTNGCKYVFHLAKATTSGTTDVECTGTNGFEITVGSICKYKITTQTGLSSVSFKNKGAGTTREITLEANVTGITSTRTTNDLFCPAAGTTGTYTGNTTVTGSSGGTHVGIFLD